MCQISSSSVYPSITSSLLAKNKDLILLHIISSPSFKYIMHHDKIIEYLSPKLFLCIWLPLMFNISLQIISSCTNMFQYIHKCSLKHSILCRYYGCLNRSFVYLFLKPDFTTGNHICMGLLCFILTRTTNSFLLLIMFKSNLLAQKYIQSPEQQHRRQGAYLHSADQIQMLAPHMLSHTSPVVIPGKRPKINPQCLVWHKNKQKI